MDDATISALPVLLKPLEVAELFRVAPETVIHWCKTGVIQDAKRLVGPGGERSMYRIPRTEVVRLLADATMAIPPSPDGEADPGELSGRCCAGCELIRGMDAPPARPDVPVA